MPVITVARSGDRGDENRFTGIVLIDRREVGYLVGSLRRSFEVEAGTHDVHVWVTRHASVSTMVRVRTGESLHLVVGRRVEWETLYANSVRYSRRIVLLCFLVGVLAFAFYPRWSGILVSGIGSLSNGRITPVLSLAFSSRASSSVLAVSIMGAMGMLTLAVWSLAISWKLEGQVGLEYGLRLYSSVEDGKDTDGKDTHCETERN